jgi:hypothetical protein
MRNHKMNLLIVVGFQPVTPRDEYRLREQVGKCYLNRER